MHGGFAIWKNLTLVGQSTYAVPQATLDGGGESRVLEVGGDSTTEVTLTDLTITHGVIQAARRRDPYPTRHCQIDGSTSVTDNRAAWGGGIWVEDGAVSLGDSATISANTAYFGGGVWVAQR